MGHLIDKDVLITEINKRRNKHFNSGGSPSSEYCYEDDEILNIIDTLEVKDVQEEPVSEDLEEASKEWLRPQLDKSYVNYGEAKMMELTHFDGYAMLDAIEFGAKWKEKQMMKEAVDAKIGSRVEGIIYNVDFNIDSNLEPNDKVKVIIIKK